MPGQRCWANGAGASIWNQFFSFLVADEVVVGHPMAAVAKPRSPPEHPRRSKVRARLSAYSKPLPAANGPLGT